MTSSAKRRFEAQESTIHRDLVAVMRKMSAYNLRVNRDLLGQDTAVTITFDRNNKRYISSCATHKHPLDNLRAAQLAIDYTYRIAEAYGVAFTESGQDADMFDRIFSALEAPLDPGVLLLGDGSADWWGILGVAQTASKTEIVNAYRALAKVYHPDVGGKAEDFQRLRAAYETGIKKAAK